MGSSSPASYLVQEYFELKMLSKLGISRNIEDLTVFEVNAYSIIASEINRLEKEEIKKSRKKK